VLGLGTLVFPAVIIGGMDSLAGAAIGSVVLGVGTSAATIYLGGQWSDFVVYVGLLVVLAVRPYGIFGTRELARL
jgi:branched-chain amino acid transport system permease protein